MTDKLTLNTEFYILKPVKLKDLTTDDLYDICESEHSSCNDNCPIYKIIKENGQFNNSCDCFKNGQKMKEFILKFVGDN